MAIFVHEKWPEDHYLKVPNELARSGLSPTAKAVWIYVRSHHDGWNMSAERIGKAIGLSRSTVSRALRELETAGWLSREQQQSESGQWSEMVYRTQLSPIVPENRRSEPLHKIDSTVDRCEGSGGGVSGKIAKPQVGTVAQNTADGFTVNGEMTHHKKTNSFKKTNELPTEVLKKTPSTASVEDAFDNFWSFYPRRVGKRAAQARFTAACKRAGGPEPILAGAKRLANDPNLPEPKFIPHPATWLNRDGWLDDPYPPDGGQGSGTQGDKTDVNAWLGLTDQPPVIDAEVINFNQKELP